MPLPRRDFLTGILSFLPSLALWKEKAKEETVKPGSFTAEERQALADKIEDDMKHLRAIRWVPVEERLPDPELFPYVLTATPIAHEPWNYWSEEPYEGPTFTIKLMKNTTLNWRIKRRGIVNWKRGITHWAEVPAPPTPKLPPRSQMFVRRLHADAKLPDV